MCIVELGLSTIYIHPRSSIDLSKSPSTVAGYGQVQYCTCLCKATVLVPGGCPDVNACFGAWDDVYKYLLHLDG